jgi:hypothetical protein
MGWLRGRPGWGANERRRCGRPRTDDPIRGPAHQSLADHAPNSGALRCSPFRLTQWSSCAHPSIATSASTSKMRTGRSAGT